MGRRHGFVSASSNGCVDCEAHRAARRRVCAACARTDVSSEQRRCDVMEGPGATHVPSAVPSQSGA